MKKMSFFYCDHLKIHNYFFRISSKIAIFLKTTLCCLLSDGRVYYVICRRKTCDAAINFFFGQSQKGPGKFSIFRKVTSHQALSTKNLAAKLLQQVVEENSKSDFICGKKHSGCLLPNLAMSFFLLQMTFDVKQHRSASSLQQLTSYRPFYYCWPIFSAKT